MNTAVIAVAAVLGDNIDAPESIQFHRPKLKVKRRKLMPHRHNVAQPCTVLNIRMNTEATLQSVVAYLRYLPTNQNY